VTEFTRLLADAGAGDARAAAALLPLVYQQLRALASRKMRHEMSGQTLEATSLVHEAYLRLVNADGEARRWDSKGHFFAAAAESMRRILIERARRRNRAKHGAGRKPLHLDGVEVTAPEREEDLLALDEALTALAAGHPEKAKLVNLRYFAGLTHEEAAQAMGVSVSTADRHWAYARAWLYRHMSGDDRRTTHEE
jgi:RNA polymerase sigma factor (TIGR02999 family)